MRVVGNRILVEKQERNEVTESGIVVQSRTRAPVGYGIVTHVGPGKVLPSGVTVPVAVRVGETVIYRSNAGMTISVEGVDLLLMTDEDVLAVEE